MHENAIRRRVQAAATCRRRSVDLHNVFMAIEAFVPSWVEVEAFLP